MLMERPTSGAHSRTQRQGVSGSPPKSRATQLRFGFWPSSSRTVSYLNASGYGVRGASENLCR